MSKELYSPYKPRLFWYLLLLSKTTLSFIDITHLQKVRAGKSAVPETKNWVILLHNQRPRSGLLILAFETPCRVPILILEKERPDRTTCSWITVSWMRQHSKIVYQSHKYLKAHMADWIIWIIFSYILPHMNHFIHISLQFHGHALP